MARIKKQESAFDLSKVDPGVISEWLSSLIAEKVNQQILRQKQQKKGRRKRGEPRVGFNLLIPHRLYVKLKNYVEYYADKGESITSIILAGLEKELKERFERKMIEKGKV